MKNNFNSSSYHEENRIHEPVRKKQCQQQQQQQRRRRQQCQKRARRITTITRRLQRIPLRNETETYNYNRSARPLLLISSILFVLSTLSYSYDLGIHSTCHAFQHSHHRHHYHHRHHRHHHYHYRRSQIRATKPFHHQFHQLLSSPSPLPPSSLYLSSSSSSPPSSSSSSSSSQSINSSSNSSSNSSGGSGGGGIDYIAQLGKPVQLRYTTYYDGTIIDHNNEANVLTAATATAITTDIATTTTTATCEQLHEPVIFLHGLLGQKRNFASLCTSLSKQLRKRRIIYALDLRNHGDNHHDWRDEMSYTHMCHDVLAFMNNKQLSNAVLIGHSMGGKVAKSLALSYPNRIAGLVVLDIAPVTYTTADPAWKAVKGIIDSLRDVKIERGMTKRHVDRDLRATVEDPALRAFVLTNLDEGGGGGGGRVAGSSSSSKSNSNDAADADDTMLQWKININSISTQLDVIAGFDYLHSDDDSQSNGSSDGEDLVVNGSMSKSRIYEGDTFFINGGTSSFVKGKHMEVISQYFPNYMLTTIRGSGHWVHAEAPDDTLALLKRYLDR